MEPIFNVGDDVIVVEVTDDVGDDGDGVILLEAKDDFGDGFITVEDSVEDDVEERAVDGEDDVDTVELTFNVGAGVIVEEVTDEVGDDVVVGPPSILPLCVDEVEVTVDDADNVDLVRDVGIISGYDVRAVLADESLTQETDTSS